jgi:hypothetical protein
VLGLAVLGGYFATVAALGGRERGWARMGIPVSRTRFGDLLNLTSAWQCTRRGIAVLPVNPCDPTHRPADFPQVWLLLSHLGLGPGDTFALGLAQGALFLLAALFVLPAGASLKLGALYAVALCSPAVMLGVERENPDLSLFPLVLLAVLAAKRRTRGEFGSAGLVLLAAILKLFPIFALGFLVRRGTRTALLAAAGAGAGFVVYALATFAYLHKLLRAIPDTDTYAYGVRLVSDWFSLAAEETVHALNGYRLWDSGLLCSALAVAWFVSRRLRPGLGAFAAGPVRDLDLFAAGACIYLGSYAFSLSNDYRLVFLLLTVPQLERWTRERRWLAFVTLPALVVTMWLDEWTEMPGVRVILDWWNRTTAIGNPSFPLPIVVIVQYVLFTAFATWLFATAPPLLDRLRERRAAAIVAPE